jgi:hypothetical protein
MREDSMFKALKVRLLVLALGLFFAGATQGATILVTSRTDVIAVDGVVTLREALNSINAGADVNADVTANRSGAAYGTSDTLTFNFVGGGGVIPLANALGPLTITKTVNIMGFTQPTALANSAATGDNSNHQIVVSGFLLNAGVDCMDITGQPSSGTQIRGFVFDQCPAAGIAITNSKNNVIAGDFFGTDSAGNFSAGAGNTTGLSIAANAGTDDISGNQIGGPNPADRNVISGNTTREMLIGNFGGATAVTTGIFVQNSYIGMNAAGTTAVTGSQQGIFLSDITGATIGGASGSLGGSCSGVCNLISGSANGVGVAVQGSTPTSTSGTLIQGNFIGTDVTGTLARPNGQLAHINISQSAAITIGGTAAGTGNLISGEPVQGTGILIDGGVVGPVNIQGNFIGTTTTGNAVLANGGPGIHIVGSTNVNIGGTTASARNVIGGNGNGNTPKGPGILVEGNVPFSTGTAVIQGNNIGIGADGTSNIGNIGNGIDFASNATGSTVGATTSGGLGGNIIAFNGAGRTNGAGVGAQNSSTANKILTNSIFSNTGITTGIGIDLSATAQTTDGPSANDGCDGDTGGNNLQNFPVLTSAGTTGASIQITGTLNSTASTTFTIEFFSDTPGTQGRTFLGSTSATTNGACTASFNPTLVQSVPVGVNITASATDPSGNTSEFSTAVVTVSAGPPAPTIAKLFGAATIPLNGTTSLSFTITNPDGANPRTGVAFTDNLPAGLLVATPNGLSGTCGAGTITATAGSGAVSLAGGTLAAGGNCTFSVNVTGTTAGVKNNSTQVTSTEASPGNTTNASITVIAPPTISKAFGAANLPLNNFTSLSFTINNPNATTALTSVGFADTLPAGLVVSTPNGLAGSCGGGTITAVAGSGSVSLSNATLAQSASCTFSVNITGTTSGTKNNTTGNVNSTEGGAGGTASASVTVCSTPTITCPGSITKFADSGQLSASVNPGTPVTSGGCDPVTVTGVRSDGKPLNAPYPIGVTLITWTAKDVNNNTSSCTQSIVVMTPSGQRRRIP